MPADPLAGLQRVYLEEDLARALGTGVDAVRSRARTGKTLRGWNSQQNPTNVWLYDADFADAHLPEVASAALPYHFIAGLTSLGDPARPPVAPTRSDHPVENLDLELEMTHRALNVEREERLRAEREAARVERDAARVLLESAQADAARARDEVTRLKRALAALAHTIAD